VTLAWRRRCCRAASLVWVCETSTLGGRKARLREMLPISNITIAGCWIAAIRGAFGRFCPSQLAIARPSSCADQKERTTVITQPVASSMNTACFASGDPRTTNARCRRPAPVRQHTRATAAVDEPASAVVCDPATACASCCAAASISSSLPYRPRCSGNGLRSDQRAHLLPVGEE
jgi:hypothetical protein